MGARLERRAGRIRGDIMTENAMSVSIHFEYDEQYREQAVQESEPDSWIQVRVQIGNTDIYGGSESAVTGFACGIVLNLLDSVEAIQRNQRHVIEFEYGPTWLSLDVVDDCTVEVAACHTYEGAKNPKERIDVDRVETVRKEAWREAVLELAHEFENTVTDMNDGLEDHPAIDQIQERRREVERSAT